MEIRIFENKEELSKVAAQYFIDVINKKDNPILGLATGSSPLGMYKELINAYNNKEVDFKNVVTFNLDEYVGIDQNHEQSYFKFMRENLFNNININLENTHIPSGMKKIEEACDEYNELLSKNVIDIQILGIGSNGHIAFNEPGTPFTSVTHCIDLQEKTIRDNARFFDGDINLVPKKSITMGLSNIVSAKQIILIATGENKAEAIKKLLVGDVNEDMPASILQNHDNVVVLVDRAAMKEIIKN
jgi:glucosamine-6-phosphate deaminase